MKQSHRWSKDRFSKQTENNIKLILEYTRHLLVIFCLPFVDHDEKNLQEFVQVEVYCNMN